MFACGEFCGINSTLETAWDCKLKVHIPFAIIKIVFMEVNCSVLIEGTPKVDLSSGPVVARDRSLWIVHSLTMPSESREIDNSISLNALRKIPIASNIDPKCASRGSRFQNSEFFFIEDSGK